MEIAILSDTHLPRGDRRLPAACLERLAAADLIIHAGDITTLPVLSALQTYGALVAVHGNADDAEVRAALPAHVEVPADGARIAVVHDGGPAAGRPARMARRFPGVDAVIFGHSHVPLHERDPVSGVQIFNPGSPTDKRRQPSFTMGWATASRGGVRFSLVDLGTRRG